MTLAVVVIVLVAINAGAAAYLERLRAKERQFLVNAALSNNTYEFALRQSASTPAPVARETDEIPDQMPEGLY